MISQIKSRVFLADEDSLARDGLAASIERQPDMACCGKAGSFAGARDALAKIRPDLAVIDLRTNPGDGIEFIKSLRAQFPKLRMLALSGGDESVFAERALRAGALGYVAKGQPDEETIRAMRTVLAGEVYVARSAVKLLLRRVLDGASPEARTDFEDLTDRELHVYQLLGGGLSTRQIARHLCLSGKTVETYRARLKQKLRVSTAAALVRSASEWSRKQASSPRPNPGWVETPRKPEPAPTPRQLPVPRQVFPSAPLGAQYIERGGVLRD
jgi:DNA-binding NarL/FixJ family response regulator